MRRQGPAQGQRCMEAWNSQPPTVFPFGVEEESGVVVIMMAVGVVVMVV